MVIVSPSDFSYRLHYLVLRIGWEGSQIEIKSERLTEPGSALGQGKNNRVIPNTTEPADSSSNASRSNIKCLPKTDVITKCCVFSPVRPNRRPVSILNHNMVSSLYCHFNLLFIIQRYSLGY